MLAMDVLEETVELSLDPRLLSQATAAICGDGLASFSSPLALTVEHVSSYHLLCSHQTKAGLKLLYAVLNTVSKPAHSVMTYRNPTQPPPPSRSGTAGSAANQSAATEARRHSVWHVATRR